jgi:hypothetical protein
MCPRALDKVRKCPPIFPNDFKMLIFSYIYQGALGAHKY